ncbi:MAG TPA: RimK/LysX family protein, partial [Candidatus Saccharimonadaceae bacterium]|nr:RimK/LysX family protein [Candidatus Saccharimonadaceae bacterium]
ALPDLGVSGVLAKVDTGAWSGALHCTDVYEKDGLLTYTPLGDKNLTASTREYEMRTVRSATGHEVRRYLVPFTLAIHEKIYHTTLGLSDRTLMQREMLLGRKFLIDNNILVDVTLTLDDDYEAEMFL